MKLDTPWKRFKVVVALPVFAGLSWIGCKIAQMKAAYSNIKLGSTYIPHEKVELQSVFYSVGLIVGFVLVFWFIETSIGWIANGSKKKGEQ